MAKRPVTPSYGSLLNEAAQLLYDASPTPRIDAEVLLQHIVSKPLAWLIAYADTTAQGPHTQSYFELVALRQQGHPIAYLTGHKEFWTLDLKVNPNVLIPRPDTETLVEQALERLNKDSATDVLDLGTGSGAIGLAIAKERPLSKVLATDFKKEALAVAKANAERNGLKNIDFLRTDWFSAIPGKAKFDLIAANPPYVEEGDPHLMEGDLRFEPDSALVSSGAGLDDLESIIKGAQLHLKPNGWLIVEHGFNQADPVGKLFNAAGYSQVELFEDINGLPRCTTGRS